MLQLFINVFPLSYFQHVRGILNIYAQCIRIHIIWLMVNLHRCLWACYCVIQQQPLLIWIHTRQNTVYGVCYNYCTILLWQWRTTRPLCTVNQLPCQAVLQPIFAVDGGYTCESFVAQKVANFLIFRIDLIF